MILPKRVDIDKAKAQERKTLIDEGMNLAHRVDELRAVRLQEEANFKAWRDGNVKSVQEEIAEKTKERDAVKAEIASLYEERAKLIAPLDTAWDDITEKQSELEKREEALSEKECLAQLKLQELADKNSEIAKRNKASLAREKSVDKIIKETEAIRDSAENEKAMIAYEHDLQNQKYGHRLSEVETLKESYENGLRVIDLERIALEEREADLIIREKELARRTANLQRAYELQHDSQSTND